MSGRILPNLNPLVAPPIGGNETFGLSPPVWWLFFRRDLQRNHRITHMTGRQWALALSLGVHRRVRPYLAAQRVAACA